MPENFEKILAWIKLKTGRHIGEVLISSSPYLLIDTDPFEKHAFSSALFISTTLTLPAETFWLVSALPGVLKVCHHQKEKNLEFFALCGELSIQWDIFFI